ncbi:MAG: hypothetical protein P1U56_04890 [Saprospiraceae bacterium]|nr:hypothetical protein [Saprospiraceae bacterium]
MKYVYLIMVIFALSCFAKRNIKITDSELKQAKEQILIDRIPHEIYCNEKNYLYISRDLEISNFSEDVIYNLNWNEEIILKSSNKIFFKDFLECLVNASNDGDIRAIRDLQYHLTQICSIIPSFTKSDFLELDIFINDIISKINNQDLLRIVLNFAKINQDPDELFPSNHGSYMKYRLYVIKSIVSKQSESVKGKYKRLYSELSDKNYKITHSTLLNELIRDIGRGIISLEYKSSKR